MLIFPLLLLASIQAPPTNHESSNLLFRELRETGVAISPTLKAPLPAPSLADGLDAKAQRAVLIALAGQEDQVEELTRPSIVSPHILKIRAIKPSDPHSPAFGVDFWFIAYGDLETIAKENFLKDLLNSTQKDRKVHILTEAELAKRKLKAQPDEGYSHTVSTVMDKVQLLSTNYACTSKTSDSIVIASRLDPRFQDDAEYPNQWRLLEKNAEGKVEFGPPQPYAGAGSYLKITRLAAPAGALLVESHLIYTEPKPWFNGANLLRSKMPLLVQSEVRSFRKELSKRKPSSK
jgi:hypothetical protein